MRYWTAAGVQTADDAERIVRLGAEPDRVSVIGNLKRAPARPGPLAAEPAPHEANGSQGPLLIAGSSHRGEEEILANVFLMLKRCFPTLRMVLAPRHPERFSEVERLLSAHGIVFDKRSALGRNAVFTRDVMVLDTLGELERFYAIGDLAFVGGSLVDVGGHNLLEPARYGKPVLFGPFMANFRSLADEMKRSGGAIEVRNAEELAGSIAELLRDPAKRKAIGEKAFGVAAEDPDVLQRSMALAERYLQP
jgi:3-deoxy-D-manno-octulosonic-acid transferase